MPSKLETAIAKVARPKLASAKANLAIVVKRGREPVMLKGQRLSWRGPYYVVVDAKGRLSYESYGDGPRKPAIYFTFKGAQAAKSAKTDRVVRLDTMVGVVS